MIHGGILARGGRTQSCPAHGSRLCRSAARQRAAMARTVGFLLGPGFWITALAMMAAGLWLPGDYGVLHHGVPVFLGGILFFTALKVELRHVGGALHGRGPLLRLGATALVKLIVLPLAAWAITRLIAPDWALGMLLVMAMPAGLSSAAMSDLYRANVPFALAFTCVTSLLCPLTVPLLIAAFDHTGARIDPALLAGRALYILVLLATPLALAQLVRAVAPELVKRHYGRWGYGAVLSSCLLIFVSISGNRHAWEAMPQVPVLALAVGGAVLAHRWMPAGEAAAFGFCCLWMNNGLSVAFSDRFYHGNAGVILPSVLMQLPIVAYVALFGRWTGRRSLIP
jgi:BASS family bile acid:Na+ symporter